MAPNGVGNKLISVITVSFNAADTIAATLDSVACQSHADVEYIVVDGASTDGTLEVIKHHGTRVATLVSEPDSGIYDAMNKGLRQATGRVIGFLNANDIYAHSGVLALVSSTMEADNLDAVFGDVAYYKPHRSDRPMRRFRSDRFRPDRIAWGWMPAHPTLFMKRQLFERFGCFRSDYRIAGDFELVARMFHGGTLKYLYVPEVLVHMQAGGLSTGGWRNTVILNSEVLRACKENGIKTTLPKILSKYPAKLLEFLRT